MKEFKYRYNLFDQVTEIYAVEKSKINYKFCLCLKVSRSKHFIFSF